MAHARRGFVEAAKVAPLDPVPGEIIACIVEPPGRTESFRPGVQYLPGVVPGAPNITLRGPMLRAPSIRKSILATVYFPGLKGPFCTPVEKEPEDSVSFS